MKLLVIIIGAIVVLGGAWILTQSGSKDDAMMQKQKDEKMIKEEEEKAMIKKEEDEKMMKEDEKTVKEEDDAMIKKDDDDKMMKKDDAMVKSSDRYVEYSKAAFDGAKNTRRVLFFYASWCPICKPADAAFQAKKAEIPSDVTVIRVNYNDPQTDAEEKALAAKYGVTYQHTYVQIDASGNVVTKWNGGALAELQKNVK